MYSALTLRRIDLDEPAPRTGLTVRGLLKDVADGVRWAYRGSGLAALALSTHAWFVGHAIVGVVLAPYVLRTLDLSAFEFGVIGAAGGVGALSSARSSRPEWVDGSAPAAPSSCATSSMPSESSSIVLAGQPMSRAATLAVIVVGQGIYGVAMGMSNSHETSYRQLVTPDELQARTNTTLRSLNRAAVVVTAPIAGILADAWGIRPMLLVAAAVFALVAAGLGATSFRNVRAPV